MNESFDRTHGRSGVCSARRRRRTLRATEGSRFGRDLGHGQINALRYWVSLSNAEARSRKAAGVSPADVPETPQNLPLRFAALRTGFACRSRSDAFPGSPASGDAQQNPPPMLLGFYCPPNEGVAKVASSIWPREISSWQTVHVPWITIGTRSGSVERVLRLKSWPKWDFFSTEKTETTEDHGADGSTGGPTVQLR